MKTIIFIDGENFVYQLRDTLAKRRLVKYRDELSRVNIRALLANTLQDETIKQASIRYYASKVHIIDRTPELKERTERYAADAEVWKQALTDQRIEFVEAGHLLVRDGKPCQECGHREPVLTEKGVDVQLATDLIRSSGDNVRLVLLSSDGDLMPAVEEAKRRGSDLVYVGFRGVSNAALSRIASQRFTVTTKLAAAVLAPKPKAKVKTQVQPIPEKPYTHTSPEPVKPHKSNASTAKKVPRQGTEKVSETSPKQTSKRPTRQASGQTSKKPTGRTEQSRNSGHQQPAGAVTGSRLASILPPLPPAKPSRKPREKK